MIEGIVECLGILTLQIEDLMKEHQEKVVLMKKGTKSCVISVTTLDAQPKIFKHLLINRILEAEPQYVSYATTLDIQKSTIEWTKAIMGRASNITEGTMEETSKIEATMGGTLEMVE